MCSDWGLGVGPERADRITGGDDIEGKGNRGEQALPHNLVSQHDSSIYLRPLNSKGRSLLVPPGGNLLSHRGGVLETRAG